MAFPASFIDELLARNPIEDVVGQHVVLRRSGANLFGLCPFHGEKTASFSVAPDKGLYYCFGCHKGGGPIQFVMEIEGLEYHDAVRNLANRVGLEVPGDEEYKSRFKQQERLWALHKEAARFFHSQLYSPIGQNALNYALGRGMSRSILTTFGVGYAPDSWDSMLKAMKAKGYTEQELKDSGLVSISKKNFDADNTAKERIYDRFRDRLMFPIIDVRGNVIGFGGRTLKTGTDDAKYLNSPETMIFNKRKNLFGLNLAKKTKQKYMILVEGNVDVVALHQYGFDNAVASLGTSLTEEQVTLLTRYTEEIVLIYDGDEAGQRATQRAIPILEKAGIAVKVLQLRDAKDPDEFLKKFGADKFKVLLEGSANRVEYQLNAIARKYDLKVDEQRLKFFEEAAELVSSLNSAVQREVYGIRAAEAASISYEAMKVEMEKAHKRRLNREKKKQEKIDLSPALAAMPKSRNIRYDNLKSAIAEEGILALLLRDPSLMAETKQLSAVSFSVPLLGRVFEQLRLRYAQGLELSVAALEDLEPEEMSHITGIAQRQQGPASVEALRDCIRTVLTEHQRGGVSSDEDLLKFRNQLKESKGRNL